MCGRGSLWYSFSASAASLGSFLIAVLSCFCHENSLYKLNLFYFLVQGHFLQNGVVFLQPRRSGLFFLFLLVIAVAGARLATILCSVHSQDYLNAVTFFAMVIYFIRCWTFRPAVLLLTVYRPLLLMVRIASVDSFKCDPFVSSGRQVKAFLRRFGQKATFRLMLECETFVTTQLVLLPVTRHSLP